MTIQEAFRFGFSSLSSHSESCSMDIELLLAKSLFYRRKPSENNYLTYVHAIDKTRLAQYSPTQQLSRPQEIAYKKLIAKRAQNTPIAYLTNVKHFYHLPFYVDKRVLIPRPQTEALVEKVINLLTFSPSHPFANPTTILDIGTGSGCIIVSIVKTLQKQSVIARFDEACLDLRESRRAISPDASRRDRSPRKALGEAGHTSLTLVRDDNVKNITFIATDTGQEALTVAKRNARIHGVSRYIRFIRTSSLPNIETKNLVIVANLPYLDHRLTSKLTRAAPELGYEPQQALFAPNHGLEHYRNLIQQLKHCQKKHINVTCFFEIDPHQRTLLSKRLDRVLNCRSQYRNGVVEFDF